MAGRRNWSCGIRRRKGCATSDWLRHFGLVAPRIEVKADMQRYNTIELMGPQNDIVSPTFDFMYQQIIEPKELTK